MLLKTSRKKSKEEMKRASNTPNLNLYKWNTATDGEQEFNVEEALNKNWDKIDNSLQPNIKSLTIPKNTTLTNNYIVTLPFKYIVGNNSLQVLLCRTSISQRNRLHRIF